jgi:putative peptide zinc metalloprotease protein
LAGEFTFAAGSQENSCQFLLLTHNRLRDWMPSMMEFFSFDYQQYRFTVRGSSWNGLEEVMVDDQVVSKKRNLGFSSLHEFALTDLGQCELGFTIDIRRALIAYQLRAQGRVLVQSMTPLHESYTLARPAHADDLLEVEAIESQTASAAAAAPRRRGNWIVLAGIVFKLFKSAKIFKAALVAASVSAYSIIFSVEFAIALVAVLMFHEYGHLRAMKKFGIPTKGMYLIPFVGGLAVGDKPRSRWQDVYISLMGPIYGLAMTLAFYIGYLITDSHFMGLVASLSGLINLFNLLPIYPLDGGRVVKSLVFSGRKTLALIFLLGLSALFFALSIWLGFALIGFFIVLGVADILTEWKLSLAEDITPLNRYGIFFCTLWYLGTIAAFLLIIVLVAYTDLPGAEIATSVLDS